MSAVLLVIGLVALAAKLNAYRPTRLRFLREPSFFFSWIVIELAGWWLALEVAAAAGLTAAGALRGWAGWVGLALLVVSWAALVRLIVISGRTSATLRAAGAPPDCPVGFPHSQVIFPFLLTHRRGAARLKNIGYAEVAGEWLRLDIYLPNGAAEAAQHRHTFPRPGILQLHGGDWSFGDKRAEGIPLLGHLAANGWLGINVNYRLSPKVAFPVHLQDVKRAIAWYREHAAEFGADPEFLCITGGSAGAHLATIAALTPNEARYQPGFENVNTRLRAAVPWYGVYDFTNRIGTWQPHEMRMLERVVMQRTLADNPADFAAASPVDLVRPDAPPFLVVHGDIDTLAPVAEARAFTSALRAVSTQPVVYAELVGAQHAFDVFPSHRCARAVEAAAGFLTGVHEAYLAGEQVRNSQA
ncbi:MAG TPA: alpha/beta hydrolase [Streptosporangiaceae bacterium]|nr:alpha/beta hydrolase [Streptosporangiaceae bacterium]